MLGPRLRNAGVFLSGFFGCAVVWAQQPANSDSSAPGAASTTSSVIVTGTRIGGVDTVHSSPVVSVDSSAIEYSGITNITDFLRRLPALTGSLSAIDTAGGSANDFIGDTGLNLLDLRNLGVDRTLVLVNGRRHVASLPGSVAIDANTIPVDLIERIDVTTGGASAIYGADGVSGVVNFILKDNFTGFRVRSQFGAPQEGANKQAFVSATAGSDFAANRGNVAVALEFSRDNRLRAADRAYASSKEFAWCAIPTIRTMRRIFRTGFP